MHLISIAILKALNISSKYMTLNITNTFNYFSHCCTIFKHCVKPPPETHLTTDIRKKWKFGKDTCLAFTDIKKAYNNIISLPV